MTKLTKKDQAKNEIVAELKSNRKNLGRTKSFIIEGLKDIASKSTINAAIKELVAEKKIVVETDDAKQIILKRVETEKEMEQKKRGAKRKKAGDKRAANRKANSSRRQETEKKIEDKKIEADTTSNLNFDRMAAEKASPDLNSLRLSLNKPFTGDNEYAILYQKEQELAKSLSTFDNEAIARRVVDLEKDFAYVLTINANTIEEVFFRMQADNWSPEGEARDIISGMGLVHTSMSVGDVAIDLSSGEIWRCAQAGWVHLNPKKDKKPVNKPAHKAPKKKAAKKTSTGKKITRIGSVIMAISKGAPANDLTKLAEAADKVYQDEAGGKSNVKESRTLVGWVMQALTVAKEQKLDLTKIEL